MDSTLMAVNLPSLVIMDIFWIQNIEVELEPQLTVYLMEIGVIMLHSASLVPTLS